MVLKELVKVTEVLVGTSMIAVALIEPTPVGEITLLPLGVGLIWHGFTGIAKMPGRSEY